MHPATTLLLDFRLPRSDGYSLHGTVWNLLENFTVHVGDLVLRVLLAGETVHLADGYDRAAWVFGSPLRNRLMMAADLSTGRLDKL